MRNAAHRLARDLERGNSLFASHRRKRVQEDLERIACLEVLEKTSGRNASTDEHRFAAHDLWIAVDDLSCR